MDRTVTVVPEEGLHARPAAKFVEAANRYDCDLSVAAAGGDEFVDARSMLAVTSLGVGQGDDVVIRAEGDDAAEALDALETVLSTPEHDTDDTDD